ncbi:MAG: hypothetical protein AAF468_20660 [Pseudomonadota bacterium]
MPRYYRKRTNLLRNYKDTVVPVEDDWGCYCDGVHIARIYKHDAGPRLEMWQWFSTWDGRLGGITDTLEDALAEVKVTHERFATSSKVYRPPAPFEG